VGRANIYVRGEDEEVWGRAEKLAGEPSTSRVITQALRAYVRSREGNPMERLTFEVEIGGEKLTRPSWGDGSSNPVRSIAPSTRQTTS